MSYTSVSGCRRESLSGVTRGRQPRGVLGAELGRDRGECGCTALDIGNRDPLDGRVRALAAGAEDHGWNASLGDQRSVRPVRLAADVGAGVGAEQPDELLRRVDLERPALGEEPPRSLEVGVGASRRSTSPCSSDSTCSRDSPGTVRRSPWSRQRAGYWRVRHLPRSRPRGPSRFRPADATHPLRASGRAPPDRAGHSPSSRSRPGRGPAVSRGRRGLPSRSRMRRSPCGRRHAQSGRLGDDRGVGRTREGACVPIGAGSSSATAVTTTSPRSSAVTPRRRRAGSRPARPSCRRRRVRRASRSPGHERSAMPPRPTVSGGRSEAETVHRPFPEPGRRRSDARRGPPTSTSSPSPCASPAANAQSPPRRPARPSAGLTESIATERSSSSWMLNLQATCGADPPEARRSDSPYTRRPWTSPRTAIGSRSCETRRT